MSFHQGWLPREGFHADVLGSIIKKTLLNPYLALPLALATRYLARVRDSLTTSPRTVSVIYLLAALSALRTVNNYLNYKAVNNGVSDHYNWNKEVVLVTGGSDGIGKQIVLMLASKNIQVVILDIQEPCFKLPETVTFYKCDITSTEAITATATKIRHKTGPPTVLILNAGVCRGKPLLENTDADLDITFGVNTISHYKLAREFVPDMIAKDHGMVVTVASSAAWVTSPRMTEYAASKAAALAFHEGLAAELASVHNAKRVRTVVVNQGYTKTALFQGFGVKSGQFAGPALEVDTVAEAIVRQVLSGTSGQIIVPGFYKLLIAHFRSLPTWLQHNGRKDLGNLMQDWTGRQVPIPSLAHAVEKGEE